MYICVGYRFCAPVYSCLCRRICVIVLELHRIEAHGVGTAH